MEGMCLKFSPVEVKHLLSPQSTFGTSNAPKPILRSINIDTIFSNIYFYQ